MKTLVSFSMQATLISLQTPYIFCTVSSQAQCKLSFHIYMYLGVYNPFKLSSNIMGIDKCIQNNKCMQTLKRNPSTIQLNSVVHLLNKISDIAITIVELLLELTDVDVLNESEEGAEVLLDALVNF